MQQGNIGDSKEKNFQKETDTDKQELPFHQPAWQHGVLEYQVIYIHHVHIYLMLNFYSFLIFK